MKKIKKIALVLNIVFAILLIISYFSINISPEKSLLIAFNPFIYAGLFIINILFIIFWIIFKWYFSLISALSIFITIQFVNLFIRFTSYINSRKNEVLDLKLMSYNVMVFGLYNWQQNNNIKSNILKIIDEENPDILCLQEAFWLSQSNNFITLDSVKILLNTSNIYKSAMSTAVGGQNFGLATISKYPIVNSYSHKFEDSFNGFIYNDVVINNDTVRIYNCHMQSIQLNQNDYTLIETLSESELSPKIMVIFKKYLNSYQQRAAQANLVRTSIDSCKYPVIACGDFNDIPVSYTYFHIKGNNLHDTFTSRGNHLDNTWNHFKIKQRIDYILYEKDFECLSHKVVTKDYSDHYPVVTELNIKSRHKSLDN